MRVCHKEEKSLAQLQQVGVAWGWQEVFRYHKHV